VSQSRDSLPGQGPSSQDIGRAIASLRVKRGMKRTQLATAVGISYPYLSEIENGNKPGSIAKLQTIAASLGTTHAQLLLDAQAIADMGDTRGPNAPAPSPVLPEPLSDTGTVAPTARGLMGYALPAALNSSSGDEDPEALIAEIRRSLDAWFERDLAPRLRAALGPGRRP
jgi:DNA-binding XRE family transcriptional regulator